MNKIPGGEKITLFLVCARRRSPFIRKTVVIIKILPAEIALFLCARCGSGLLFWNGNHVLYRIP